MYGLFTVMGLIPGLNTTFGLVPLYGHDVWLHALTAAAAAAAVIAAFGLGWVSLGMVLGTLQQPKGAD